MTIAPQTSIAPLPPAAVEALDRLERALLPLEIVRAVTRFEVASARKAELEAKPTREWSGADFDSWVGCERTILDAVTALVTAGRVHLIEALVDPIVLTAAEYRKAAARAETLAAQAATGEGLPAIDVRSWEFAEELKAGARATLADAGRLELIEAAS